MTDKVTIRTNNQSRLLLSWYELTEKEKRYFDYLDTEDRQNEANFFRYRKEVYDLGEFSVIQTSGGLDDNPLSQWDAYQSDSFFSGIVFRFERCGSRVDHDRIIVGTYFC